VNDLPHRRSTPAAITTPPALRAIAEVATALGDLETGKKSAKYVNETKAQT